MVRSDTLVCTAMFLFLLNAIVKESAELENIAQLDIIIEEILGVLVSADEQKGG